MPRTSDKRERLVDAARHLIHQKGFHRTTLADIAEASEVPLGNVYYYFKTKEDICNAVIEERRQSIRTTLDGCCCKENDPKENLQRLLKVLTHSSEAMAEHGCPVGSLCQELDKTPTGLAEQANQCLLDHIDWAARQFEAMGYKNAHDMGVELVARIQGVTLVGHTLHEPGLIKKQLRLISDWIKSL